MRTRPHLVSSIVVPIVLALVAGCGSQSDQPIDTAESGKSSAGKTNNLEDLVIIPDQPEMEAIRRKMIEDELADLPEDERPGGSPPWERSGEQPRGPKGVRKPVVFSVDVPARFFQPLPARDYTTVLPQPEAIRVHVFGNPVEEGASVINPEIAHFFNSDSHCTERTIFDPKSKLSYHGEMSLAEARAKNVELCSYCLWFERSEATSQPRWSEGTSSPRLISVGDRIRFDRGTGLLLANVLRGDLTYEAAATFCENLMLQGIGDWRMPTGNESKTIESLPELGGIDGKYWSSDEVERSGKHHCRAVKNIEGSPEDWHKVLHSIRFGVGKVSDVPPFRPDDFLETSIQLGDGVKLEFVLVRPGTFFMGASAGNGGQLSHEPRHRVMITRPFFLGKYEVTQAQWNNIMEMDPPSEEGATLPAHSVSWNDCQQLLVKLNARVSGCRFRFPTEAEWEFACRAGSSADYCFGNDPRRLGDYAWFLDNTGEKKEWVNKRGDKMVSLISKGPQAVGSKMPNAWGLHDMHGNVLEWCADKAHGYEICDQTDPMFPDVNVDKPYVFRGGACISEASSCTAFPRSHAYPSKRTRMTGLRLAFDVP